MERNEMRADDLDDIQDEGWRAEDLLRTPEEIAEFEAFLDDNPALVEPFGETEEFSAEND